MTKQLFFYMATSFKKSVPYNTIRLVGDVAQWSSTEQTSLDNPGYSGSMNTALTDVSMAEMQMAAGANIDPGDGRVSTGILSPQRYGVSILSDISAGDGVYASQVDKTTSDFVGTRNYNLSGNPTDVRLGRMAQWDYTANLEQPDMDKFDVISGGSTIYISTAFHGKELFVDQPMWAWGIKKNGDNNTRQVCIVRANPNGDRFSSYAVTNRLLVSNVSDMNDILVLAPVNAVYGTTYGTNVRSFITFGRRTSVTGNVKAGLYSININTSTGAWSATSTTSANLSTQFGSNSVPTSACYVDEDLVALIVGRGAGGFDLLRVTTTGGTISSTRTALTTGGSYSQGSGIVSTRSSYGSTLKYVFPVWMETQSTYNRYVKMACYNLNSGISQVGSTITVFDVNNSIKATKVALLNDSGNGSSASHFLVGAADSSGNLRLQVVGFNTGTLSISGFASTTYAYSDTSLLDRFTITPLSAVEKTAISINGEAFVPGGTNDFEKRRYFVITISTAVETDNVRFLYGYYDITNNVLSIWDGGSFQGRNVALAENDFDTDCRSYVDITNLRGQAGAIFMPWLGGRYVSSVNKNLTFGMTALDYKPNWNGMATSDPGSTVFDTIGLELTNQTAVDTTPPSQADWQEPGVWNIRGPHWQYTGSTADMAFYSVSGSYTLPLSGISSHLQKFVGPETDANGINWNSFITDQLMPFNLGNPVYIRIRSDNGSLSATFRLPAGQKHIAYSSVARGFSINWQGDANNHAGSQWAWLWNPSGGTTNRVQVEFKQSAF